MQFDAIKMLHEVNQIPLLHRIDKDALTLKLQHHIPLFTQQELDTCNTWRSRDLTKPPQRSSNVRLSSARLRNNDNTRHWVWDPELTVPYIRSVIESMNWQCIQLVRVITMDPDCIGLVHIDDPMGFYYGVDNRNLSVTFSVLDGGSPLVFKNNGELHNADANCFIFRDDCFHGVPRTQSRRVQVRISGIPDPAFIEPLLDMSQAIEVAPHEIPRI